ncbi:MAG TPA: hypothetical protein VMW56_32270 [Candidatus Margulisiibacteriota bacterium]|nr:hypothetical protein [Candidatus Margulisiibacteriota bacterium]
MADEMLLASTRVAPARLTATHDTFWHRGPGSRLATHTRQVGMRRVGEASALLPRST